MIKHSYRTTLLLILLLMSFSFHLNAEESTNKKNRDPNVLVFTQSHPESIEIEKRINDRASLKLKEQDLNTIGIEDDIAVEELLESAAWLGAFFIIESNFSLNDDSLYLEMNCYSTWDKQLLCAVHSEQYPDSHPEEIVDKAMEKIIPVVKAALEFVKAAPPPGWDWWNQEEDREPSHEPEAAQTDKIQEAEGQNFPTPPPFSEEAQKDEMSPVSRFLISLAGAPLIATGEGAEYFDMGSHLSVFGGYRFLQRPVGLVLGGRLGWDYFKAEGVLAVSKNNFIYTGPEVQAGLPLRRGGRVFLRISGGLSYLTVDAEYTGLKYTSRPYLSLGFGGEIPVSRRLGIYYSGDYTLHFEETTVFSGFYPTFGLSLYL